MSMAMEVRSGSTEARHGIMATASVVVFCWIWAATAAGLAHAFLDSRSVTGGAAATILSIIGVAWAYTRLYARSTTLSHALGVGIAWLVLTTIAEIAISSSIHHGWYLLIGSPSHPLLRNLFLFVWVFAPALFANRKVSEV